MIENDWHMEDTALRGVLSLRDHDTDSSSDDTAGLRSCSYTRKTKQHQNMCSCSGMNSVL